MSITLPVVAHVESSLNRGLLEYEAATDEQSKQFLLFKIQVLIFFYDVALGLMSAASSKATGFAQVVSLKSLVQNLYEYDRQLHRTLIPGVMRYASLRGHPVDTHAIRREKEKWRHDLAKLVGWKSVRDAATGHYSADIKAQIELLKTLNQSDVLSVANAFTSYSVFILSLMPHRKRSAA